VSRAPVFVENCRPHLLEGSCLVLAIRELQAGLDAAWQDAKLLLSFAVGIIFMRSLEMLTIGEERQRHPKTIELYPFLT